MKISLAKFNYKYFITENRFIFPISNFQFPNRKMDFSISFDFNFQYEEIKFAINILQKRKLLK
jgi:hypothetical protein